MRSPAPSARIDRTSQQRPVLWPLLLVLCALAFSLRAGVVLAPRLDLFGTPAGGQPGILHGEEIARGNAAADVLDGQVMPLLDYQYAHFFGGSLVVSLLTVPAFALFGQSLWALKLTPVLIHLAGLVLLVRLLDRHVSRRAAAFGGLLFACTPPGYTLLTTVNWGCHSESNTLALMALTLHAGLGRSPRPVLQRFGLGAIFGFALYFGYQCALFVAALTLFDLPSRNRPKLRGVLAQIAGVLLGACPWLIYNLRHDFAGLQVYGGKPASHLGFAAAGERLQDLLVHGLPGAMFAGHRALEFLLYIAFGLLAVAALWQKPRSSSAAQLPRIAWTYMALFALVYSFSDFEVGADNESFVSFRYAMMLGPWVILAAACGLEAWACRGVRDRRLSWAATLALASTCFVATWAGACDVGRIAADRHVAGVDLASHGRWLSTRHLAEPERIPALVRRISAVRTPEDQAVLFHSMGNFLRVFGQPGPLAKGARLRQARQLNAAADVFLDCVPAPYRPAFQRLDAARATRLARP